MTELPVQDPASIIEGDAIVKSFFAETDYYKKRDYHTEYVDLLDKYSDPKYKTPRVSCNLGELTNFMGLAHLAHAHNVGNYYNHISVAFDFLSSEEIFNFIKEDVGNNPSNSMCNYIRKTKMSFISFSGPEEECISMANEFMPVFNNYSSIKTAPTCILETKLEEKRDTIQEKQLLRAHEAMQKAANYFNMAAVMDDCEGTQYAAQAKAFSDDMMRKGLIADSQGKPLNNPQKPSKITP